MSSEKGKYVTSYVNPLSFPKLDFANILPNQSPLTFEDVVESLCTPGLPTDIDSIQKRYENFSQKTTNLPIAPALPEFLEKIIWPLKHAKMGFITGNHLGCIALCGMVGEMLTLLVYEFSKITVDKKGMTRKDEIRLYGSTFEKLGQARRVEVLSLFKKIDDESRKSFDRLKSIRRLYLHFYSQPHKEIEKDAIEAYNIILKLLATCLGFTIKKDGMLSIRQEFMDYLTAKGLTKDRSEDHISA